MSLKFGNKSDVGLKRRSNQDSYVIVRGESLNGELDALFVVADGMGGILGGEVASEIVVTTFPESVQSHLAARNGDTAPIDSSKLLEDAVGAANRKVRARQAEDTQLRGMGTTCVAAILDANVLTVANVGDSRAYLLRDGRLTQITQDHSSVWEQVLAGNMTSEEARTSRFRNQITRAIGSDVNSDPDIDIVELTVGDSVLLCSDGLTSELEDDEIARLFASVADPQEACEILVEAALGAGGRDNVTVIALRYGEFQTLVLEKKPRSSPQASEDPMEAMEAWRDAGYDPVAKHGDGVPDLADLSLKVGRGPISPALLGLLFVLAVLAGGEAYALVRLNQEVTKLRKRPPEVVIRPPDRPTDHELSYGDPVLLTSKPIRDTPIAVDDGVGVFATTAKGNLVRFNATGEMSPLPDQTRVGGAPGSPVRESLLLAIDVSGNRYQINPGARVISKYDPEGLLKAAAIGKGKLVAPTALAVDTSGNLYVIDEQRVKKIGASDALQTPTGAPASR